MLAHVNGNKKYRFPKRCGLKTIKQKIIILKMQTQSGPVEVMLSVADVGSAALSSKQVAKFVPNWYSRLESSSPGFQVTVLQQLLIHWL